MDPHVATGLAYCRDVVAGRVPACRWVRLACQRQLDDLERAKGEWRYRFDEARAGRACRFLELLPHVKGPKAGELFKLEPWQCFVVTTAFGWVRKDTGARRFRRVYIEVPRGNGKSFLSSGIALYGLAADGESGAEVYSAATTTSQARITYGDAERMLRKSPALLQKLGLRISTHAISQQASGSTFGALSREAKNHDGKNIHVAVIDELHAHRTRELWDVIITGAAKRPQSLIWTITTAGFDTSGICYEVRDGVVKMLEGAENDRLFGVVYTIDDGDDWRAESSWVKANPNWHASIDHDAFSVDATEALQTASKENNFKTKHLDVWCNADVAWMQMAAWDACADPKLQEEDFAGQPCVLGLDLASKTDICAKAKVFHRDFPAKNNDGSPKLKDDGSPALERHFYLFLHSYLPEAAVESSRNASYEGWAKDGWLKTTPGDVLDFETVSEGVLEDRDRHDLREVAFDPWQATQLSQQLQAGGVTMVEVRPTVQNFSEPMKEMESLVLTGRLHHDGNPALRWMVSNVVCHTDAKGNI
ncbi:MAG: terminase large subunit, partial [Myxococcaceae bacterium]|nr:terminase large subunit [Myxococcaceae bacterium]